MKQYSNFLRKSLWVVSAAFVLVSCNDWDDHYSYKPEAGSNVKSLAQTLEEMPEAANFVKALKTTYMMNGDKVVKSITYWDLMEDNQFLTVWLPSGISDEAWAEYTAPVKDKDHKKVAQEFIQNHVARFRHGVGAQTSERIYMLNEKSFLSRPDNLGGIKYSNNVNIRCTNGILHVLNGYLDYRPSIYDYITQTSYYSPSLSNRTYDYREVLGKWFDSYTEEEIDEKKSVVSGYDSQLGKVTYADSVMIKKSILLNDFGLINEEDSNYAVVLPTPELWKEMYDTISSYFVYGGLEVDPDSLQEFYTKYHMLTDMFFNMNIQRSTADSVVSTRYNRNNNVMSKIPYNVYFRPYDSDGLFGNSCDSLYCSNGIIYFVDKWPYDDTKIYRKTIKIEAETYAYEGDKISTTRRLISEFKGKELSNVFVAMLRDRSSTPTWETEFKIKNNLKGKYDVKLVIFPCQNQQNRPNRFHPTITYMAEKEIATLLDPVTNIPIPPFKISQTFNNDTSKIDTLSLGIIDLSTCNFDKDGKNQARLFLKLKSEITGNQVSNYSSEMWLDCIILEPVVE